MILPEFASSITDAQRAELGKKMPAVGGPVVGNLGMDWHSSLPSFEKANVPSSGISFFQKGVSSPKTKPKIAVKKVGMAVRLTLVAILC